MKNNTLAVAAYWRNSLADAELGRGSWHDQDVAPYAVRSRPELLAARVDKALVDDYFKSESEDSSEVEVAIYPIMFKLKTEHGSKKQYALPNIITPVVIKGLLKRDGHFVPLPKIFIARDLLEPLDKGSFAIGHIDDLDEHLTNNPCPVPLNILELAQMREADPHEDDSTNLSRLSSLDTIWKDTLAYCDQLLGAVSKNDVIAVNGYLRAREWMVRKIGGNDTPSKRISSLYDHLRQANPDCPLLDTLTDLEIKDIKPLLEEGATFDRHLGHCSDKYPLADAQRDAMNHVVAMNPGDILAVNGPPGTGKTTLLLSIVSNYWIEAALNGGEPPVIVASSTNNQSVTNIIDAFKKDIAAGEGVFAGRWISAVSHFGFYLSSRAKRQQAGAKYIGPEFFESLESVEGIAQAREDYLHYAREAFQDLKAPSVSKVVSRLHEDIVSEASKLKQIKRFHDELCSLQATIKKVLGNNHWESLERIDSEAEESKKKFKVFEHAYINLVNHLGSQPFWYDLLKFIPSVSRQQGVRASIVVKRSIKSISADKIWDNVENLKATLREKMKSLKVLADKHQMRQRKAHGLIRRMNSTKTALSEAYRHVMTLDGIDLPTEPKGLLEASKLADTRIRFKLFLLATHYWEGRWLLEVDGNEASLLREMGSQSPHVVAKRWRRRMMLTPCAVSTFFMLPGEFKVLMENDKHRHSYLYNFIDLLIVDEAGQVLPEVAGASFSLAKKALVIGDTLQIEPIWNIPKSVDIGNLIQHEVLPAHPEELDIENLRLSGKMASCGNVMNIAQQASLYHYDEELPRGLFLYEHRRCFNEIIAYCNALSYKNRLIPSRGRHQDLEMPPNPFPPMGYVNVFGQCKSKATGTRYNLLEANTIAQWLSSKRGELEDLYGKRLEEIVGIVTPFTGQVDILRSSCRKYNIDVSPETGITIGTVHSLQGAERHIVIFSATYTKESNGGFIDASPSMLNVAVSRARDNFIVFGDMRTFNPKQSFTPRGLLATFLLKSEENKIHFNQE